MNTGRNNRHLSSRRRWAYVGLGVGVVVLAVAVFLFAFGDAILNGYGKRRVERTFAETHPGYVLQIGKLEYSIGARRLVAQTVSLSAASSTLKVGRIALTDVRWERRRGRHQP